MDAELLKLLCCPETHQDLHLANSDLVQKLNARIDRGEIANRCGRRVERKLDGALIRADRKFLYPICENIPVMLIDEAIPLGENFEIRNPKSETDSKIK